MSTRSLARSGGCSTTRDAATPTTVMAAPRTTRGDAAIVYVPAYEGGHPDHDAVNLAAALAVAARPGLHVPSSSRCTGAVRSA